MEAEDEIPRCRTLLCAVQTGGKYFGKLLQNMCENTVHKTFYNVLDENFYKHDILHLWKNDKCCLCGVSTVHHYAGSLKQRQILSVYSAIDRKCGRILCKFCPCSYKAKEGVCTSNIDITFSHALLSRVFLKSVHPSLPTCNVRRAIDEIKEIRNTAVHYPENPLHKVDFDKEWLNLKSSLLIICKYLKESTDMLEEEMEKFHYLVNTCKDCSFRIKASLERMKNGELKDSNDNGIVGNPFQMFAVCQDCARIQEGCKDAQSLIFDNLHLFMGLTPYEFLPDLEEAGALTEEDVRHIKSLDKRAKQMEAFLSILKERGISSCRKTLDILAEKDYGPAIRKMRKEKKAGCEITFAVNGNFDIEEVNALKQKTTDHTTEQSSGIGRYNLRFSVLSPQKDKIEKILKDFIESEDFSSKLNDMGPGDISVTDGSVIVHLRFKCQEDYDKFSVALSEGKLFDIVSRMWDEVKYNHQIDKQDANMIVYIQNVPGRLANSGKTECSAAFFIDTNNEFLTEELCPGTLIKYLKESHHDISEAIRIRKEHPFNRRAQSQELLKFLRNESFEFIQKCIIATQPETIKRKLEESMSSVHAVLETENKEKETMVENTLLQTGTDDIMREKEIHNQCSDCRRRQRSNKLLETVSCNACVMQDHATELLPSMFELYTSSDRFPSQRIPASTSSKGVPLNEWRIILIGKSGAEKNATWNTILGGSVFHSTIPRSAVTHDQECQIGRAVIYGKKLLVVDTQGSVDTEIVKCMGITSPGPHAFVLVVRMGHLTVEEERTFELLHNHFGQQLINFLIVVFAGNDHRDHENFSIDEYVKSLEPSSMLTKIIQKSNRRYIALNSKAVGRQNDDQGRKLFSVLEDLIQNNVGTFYKGDIHTVRQVPLSRFAYTQIN